MALIQDSGKAHELSGVDTKMETNPDSPPLTPAALFALLLCDVRRSVASVVGIEVDYTEPERLIKRYEELLAQAARRQ